VFDGRQAGKLAGQEIVGGVDPEVALALHPVCKGQPLIPHAAKGMKVREAWLRHK